MPIQHIKLPISGMTCAACAYRVERALTTSEGVANVYVNRSPGYASVRYDPTQVNLASLVKRVYSEGYGVPQGTMELSIAGLTDDITLSLVGEVITQQTGILSVEVIKSEEKVRLAYISGAVNRSEVVNAIEQAGYSVLDDPETPEGADASDRQDKGLIPKLKLLFLKIRKTLAGKSQNKPRNPA